MKIIEEACCGEKRVFCFSLRVLQDITDKFGSYDKLFDAVDGEKSIENVAWLLSRLMDAGSRYAKMNGLENPAPLTNEQILDMSGPFDIGKYKSIIFSTLARDTESSVQAESDGGNPTQAGK